MINQLKKVQQYNKDTAATPMITDYSYDAVGNRLTKLITWSGVADSEQYSYDKADKLLHWQNGANYKDYSYDRRGNLLRVTGIDDADDTDGMSLLSATLNTSVSSGVYGSVYDSVSPLSMSTQSGSASKVLEQYSWNAANLLAQQISPRGDISQFFYDGDGNRTKVTVDIDHGPDDKGTGNGQGNTNGNGNGNGNSNGNGKCHVVPPGFIPPGLAKKCGQVEEPYPDMHPGGPSEGWEKQFKKKYWELNYTNDVTLALPEPLQVTDKESLSGPNDYYRWKESYVYGSGDERLSMTYLPAYDANNGWDPHDGTAGAEPGVAPRTLYYLNDGLGSVLGLIEKDGRVSARYHYDEFGIPTDEKKFDMNWPGPDNLFGYSGLGYDYNSGLTYGRARYYKPEIGRFISEDMYKGTLGNPQSQNGYTYVYNNPLKYVDPSGHDALRGDIVGRAIEYAKQEGKVNNSYWSTKSWLGSGALTFFPGARYDDNNQFKWLFGLATKTSDYADLNTDGNAEWAKAELVYKFEKQYQEEYEFFDTGVAFVLGSLDIPVFRGRIGSPTLYHSASPTVVDAIVEGGFRTDIPTAQQAFYNNRFGSGVYLADSPATAVAERPGGQVLKVSADLGRNLNIVDRGIFDYTTAQGIARAARDKGYDSITFASAQQQGGVNTIIFDPSRVSASK